MLSLNVFNFESVAVLLFACYLLSLNWVTRLHWLADPGLNDRGAIGGDIPSLPSLPSLLFPPLSSLRSRTPSIAARGSMGERLSSPAGPGGARPCAGLHALRGLSVTADLLCKADDRRPIKSADFVGRSIFV